MEYTGTQWFVSDLIWALCNNGVNELMLIAEKRANKEVNEVCIDRQRC